MEAILLTKFFESPNLQTMTSFNNQIFPTGCQWLTDSQSKTQRFYEFILVDSGSADIQHVQGESESKIMYSKCIIKKVISPSEWTDQLTEKSFSKRFIPNTYSYQDYRMAWFRTFYLRPFDHSWFITFSSNCQTTFPAWFYTWWYHIGACSEILPKECLESYRYYATKATRIHDYQKPLAFHAEFKIPWIFAWKFKLEQHFPPPFPMTLVREFKVKFWEKFSLEVCSLKNVKNFIETGKKFEYSLKQVSDAPSTSKKKTIQNQAVKKQDTFKQLLQQLEDPENIQEFIQFMKAKTTAESESSSTESVSKTTEDHFGGPFSQDPFD